MSSKIRGPEIGTRVLLLTSLVLIMAGTTVSSLLIVRNRLRLNVQKTVAMDLRHSVETFQDLEEHRLSDLERENALLANLPSLKALMTTSDARTIADVGADFWRISGKKPLRVGRRRQPRALCGRARSGYRRPQA